MDTERTQIIMEALLSYTEEMGRRIALHVAQNYPSVFIEAIDQKSNLKALIKQRHQEGVAKVPVIKEVRQLSGLGLREAKELVELVEPVWAQVLTRG